MENKKEQYIKNIEEMFENLSAELFEFSKEQKKKVEQVEA